MSDEYQARIEDLRRGPWMEQSEIARRSMPILSEQQRATYLRPHWKDPEGITKKEEIGFRESFDQVLEYLQLIELGIETGYFSLDALRTEVEREMAPLVSSPAVCRYIYDYEFLPVRFLASRFGLALGTAPLAVPPINPLAEVRFATFLSLHSSWTDDRAIERFTMLMDHYKFLKLVNGRYFKSYLSGTLMPSPVFGEEQQRLLDELCSGCTRFVQILGDLFIQLDGGEQPFFGSFYGYWLGHFFGYSLGDQGFSKKSEGWGLYVPNRLLFPPDLDAETLKVEERRMRTNLEAMRSVWDATRELTARLLGK
jgi:hypothetical protein